MITKTRRFATFGAAAASAALLLAACSGGSPEAPASNDSQSAPSGDTDSASGTNLTVWVDSERLAVLKAAADEYSQENGIGITLVDKSIETMKADFAREAPTGKGPDIIMGAHDWIGGYVADGIISPIELGDKAAEFSDVAIKSVTFDSKIYQVPYAVENIGILRNADLIPEATPATWDAMIAAGKAAGTKYPFVVTQNGPEGDPYHVYPLQSSFGSSIFGLNEQGEYDASKLTISDEKGIAFAKWLGTVGDIIKGDISGDVAKQAFLDGDAPFWLTGPWSVRAAQDAGINLAVDPVPSAGGQEANPFAGIKGFFVNSRSENALAANDFLVNFIATEPIQTALFEAGGVLPAMTASADKAASDPTVEGFKNAGKNAIPMPSIPAMADVWEPWGIAEGDILTGADPQATWEKLAVDIQAAIDASK